MNRKIIDYRIIGGSTDPNDLRGFVTEDLANGWELYGNPFTTKDAITNHDGEELWERFWQAMVRYEE